MRPPPFNPEIRRALRIDVSAALLFAVFASVTTPFIGLILRRELGATPLQLSVMSADQADERRDRKSTRLNSSHVRISYAVFCLKKKKPLKGSLSSQDITGKHTP